MYIVTSPSLVTACDRRAKVVSFEPYVVEFAKRILVASQPSIDLLAEDILGEKGASTLRAGTMRAMHNTLMPSESLTEITQAMLKDVSSSLDLKIESSTPKEIHLFDWIRRFVTAASTNAVYGPENNPMKDHEVYDGFWAVDKALAFLGLMTMPNLIAPKASRGRSRFFNAFKEYYATGGLDTASRLIKARHDVNTYHGVSDEDIAHFDLGVCTALLVNTVPGVFWTLCHVYSNTTLLAEIRDGIEAEVYRQGKGEAATVNIPDIIKVFPLLESLVKEVLRVQSTNASARFLLKDTLIDDEYGTTYLLKKGSFLAMPSMQVHMSEAAWGPAAKIVDPTRFLKERPHGVLASSHRTFGGGNSLCPGRYFAMNEIMSVLIIMVLKYDIEPVGEVWNIPGTKQHISTSILTPISDIPVRIRPREEVQNVEFNFTW
ncbi:cytochrome P450 [Daldinia decipiens]|uniref:cytochrome P450 n=1 Tax=Daldinia decipiens TaxID=326647 RepID=UPI0020C2F85A|nr:cytochrome P450 [Daldinia decipiens]KAI1654485.1 cytochrome P450 [Daldinia decipiens]